MDSVLLGTDELVVVIQPTVVTDKMLHEMNHKTVQHCKKNATLYQIDIFI